MTDSRRLIPVKGHPGIYKRRDSYVVRFRDPQGRQCKRTARTLAHARAIRAEVKTDIDRGEYRTDSRMTFGEYAESWKKTFTGRTANGIRPDTLKRYCADLNNVIIPKLGRKRLSEITTQDLKKLVADLQAQGLSASRVRNIYAPLRAVVRTAVEENLLRYDPSAGVRIAVVHATNAEADDEGRVVAYSDQELASLMMAMPPEWKLLIRFLAQTGLRISETLALRWQDIDLGKRRVYVKRRLYQGSFAPPKTRYGRREVPIAEDLARDLWNAKYPNGAQAENSPVFSNKRGGHLDYQNVYNRILSPVQKKLGIATGAHVLRHTCATRLFKSGFSAKQVQIWLGHHSPAFTMAVYVHLLPDDLPDAPLLDLPMVKIEEKRDLREKAS